MRRRVTLKQVIFVVKLSLFPVWCWPVPQNATKLKIFFVKLYYCLNIIIEIFLVVPMIYGIISHVGDPAVLIKTIHSISNISRIIFNFIFQIANYHHIQNITFEMVYFCNFMKPHEEVVIQRYIDKCVVFHGTFMFIVYFINFATVAVLPLAHQPLTTSTEYPFDVSYQPLKTIINVQLYIYKLMVTGQFCTNIFMALLLWFASARFEILTKEMKKVTNVYQLFKYIEKHQELLKYAKEVAIAARPFALISICRSTVCLTIAILLFLTHQPVATISQYFGYVVINITEVFIYTWSAEHLMYTSKDVAQVAFNILKNKDLVEMWEYLQIIIMRSQKPITVSIPFFLPELSLNYFTSYISTIVSYFTALRAVMYSDNN